MTDAYLLPLDDLEPPEDFCAKVYVPNNDTYRRAFLGAYVAFGNWTLWERDRNHSAAIAAARWRESIDKTLLTWGMGCGCEDGEDDMTQEEVTQLIKEIMEAMAITITTTQNCGCGCGRGTGTNGDGVDYRIPPPQEPPLTPPDAGEPPGNASKSQKCSMANYLVYTLRLTLLKVKENGGDFVSFLAWLTTLFTSPADFVYAIAYQTWQWAKQTLTGSDIDVSAIFDEFYNFYVCNLFSATNETEAHSALMGSLYNTLKAYPDLSYVARLIANELPYHLLFMDNGEIDIPLGFSNRSCCGEVQENNPTPPTADMPTGYILKPVVFSSVTNIVADGAGSITANFSGNDIILKHSGASGTNVFRPRADWAVDLNAMGITAGMTVRGSYLVPRVHTAVGNGRSILFTESWGTNTASYQVPVNQAIGAPIFTRYAFSDVPLETQSIADFVATLGGVTVADTASSGGDKFSCEGSGGSNPLPVSGDFRYSAWLLVKVG